MKPAAQDPLAQLTEIRAIMERSSRFLSLSGLSGVGTGVVALAGTAALYFLIWAEYDGREGHDFGSMVQWLEQSESSRQVLLPTLLALAVPLVAGGLFCLALYQRGAVALVVPGLLVFYGLALLNGSKYTLDEIKYLGITLITLGLVALLLPGYGLLLFGAGFGLGHIGYGLLMYNRYERPAGHGAAGTKFAAP